MARTRSTARTAGKSDPIDALAVARTALGEPRLPTATHDDAARELKLLVDRREDLIDQRTATNNRLLWRLHENWTRATHWHPGTWHTRIIGTPLRNSCSITMA